MRVSGIFAQKKMPKINVPFNSACLSHPCTRVFYHKTRHQSIKKIPPCGGRGITTR